MVGTEVGEKDGTAVADDENKEGFNEDDIDGNSEEILLGQLVGIKEGFKEGDIDGNSEELLLG